jgi:hypothetical protein
MFDSTKAILDNLIASIKGQPAYAATPAPKTIANPADGSPTGPANMDGVNDQAGSSFSPPNGAASVIQSVPKSVPGAETSEQNDSIPGELSDTQNPGPNLPNQE